MRSTVSGPGTFSLSFEIFGLLKPKKYSALSPRSSSILVVVIIFFAYSDYEIRGISDDDYEFAVRTPGLDAECGMVVPLLHDDSHSAPGLSSFCDDPGLLDSRLQNKV